MAVDQGGEQPPVDEPGHGHVFRARREARDRFVAIPNGTHMEALCVQAPAAVARGEIVGIVILDGLRFWSCHRRLSGVGEKWSAVVAHFSTITSIREARAGA